MSEDQKLENEEFRRTQDILRKTQNADVIWLCNAWLDRINELNELKRILSGDYEFEPSSIGSVAGSASGKASADRKEYMREYMRKQRAAVSK